MLLLDRGNKSLWKNWSGNEQCNPEIQSPTTVEEVQSLVLKARKLKRKIRPVGSGHSFSKLVPTNDIIIDMSEMSGIIEVDQGLKIAHVYGGTKLSDLNRELFKYDLALPNLGDVDVQTLAGATATGTHGTGAGLSIISEQIFEITYVNGKGELKTIDERDPELLSALKLNLGVMGVIISMKVKLINAYKLELKTKKERIDFLLKNFENLSRDNRHFEFFWFPYTEYAQVKISNITDRETSSSKALDFINDVVMENIIYGAIIKMCVWSKFYISFFSKIVTTFIGDTCKVNWSHLVFATPRINRFNEMEISIPSNEISAAMEIVKRIILKHGLLAIIPVEVRTVKADNILLSPANGRDSVYIAVHAPVGCEYKDCFDEIELELEQVGGRPHWGKINSTQYSNASSRFEGYEKFSNLREDQDPDKIFLNDWLSQVFRKY